MVSTALKHEGVAVKPRQDLSGHDSFRIYIFICSAMVTN